MGNATDEPPAWIRHVPRGSGAPLLICHHFPKTGGSTLLRHARTRLGPDRVHTFGRHNNADRIAAGLQLLTEWPQARVDRIAYLTGHHLTRQAVNRFTGRDARLVTLVRDPFERFRSLVKHIRRTRPEDTREPEAIWADTSPNPAARELLHRFRPPGTAVELAEVVVTLRRFDAVLVTEHLDDQNPLVFAQLGLPGTRERARVYPEEPDTGAITREMVQERDAIDSEIHRRATRAWIRRGQLNAFRPVGKAE